MSLITNSFFRKLYDEFVSQYEHALKPFWTYLFKVKFPEEYFSYEQEKPASQQADLLRRVDGRLIYFEHNTMEIGVFCFHEAKKTFASDTDMQEVEGQAFEACATYCGNSHLTHVYALTTIGTLARLWKYSRGTGHLYLLFGSAGLMRREAYIDVDSEAAAEIDQNFQLRKQFPPSRIATIVDSNVPVTIQVVPSPIVPSTPASSIQSTEFSTAHMDGQWHWSHTRNNHYMYDKTTKQWKFNKG